MNADRIFSVLTKKGERVYDNITVYGGKLPL